jgi:hypothetical protein
MKVTGTGTPGTKTPSWSTNPLIPTPEDGDVTWQYLWHLPPPPTNRYWPLSVMKGVPGYNPNHALTKLLDRSIHSGMDR